MHIQTMRPQLVSKADGEMGQAIDEVEKSEETAEACMPIEDDDEVHGVEQASHEAVRIKVLPSPDPPSRQEALEHYCTQIPFRSWCPHCVKEKSKSSRHKASGGM